MTKETFSLARKLGRRLLRSGLTLVTAESCTGGWVAKAITDVPGSSKWFEAGYVTYSDEAKQRMLRVKLRTLQRFGAVSEPVVREMAQGALKVSGANLAVAISGIAGPDGGSASKPVGLVWFCWAKQGLRQSVKVQRRIFAGDRANVRLQAVIVALRGLNSV